MDMYVNTPNYNILADWSLKVSDIVGLQNWPTMSLSKEWKKTICSLRSFLKEWQEQKPEERKSNERKSK